jgi:hypothetical protein
MNPLISFTALLPLLVFYFWMFRDMTNNNALSSGSKYNLTMAFIFFNVFAAAYYFTEYKNRY